MNLLFVLLLLRPVAPLTILVRDLAGQGVEGITIILYAEFAAEIRVVALGTTDTQGRFLVPEAPVGDYGVVLTGQEIATGPMLQPGTLPGLNIVHHRPAATGMFVLCRGQALFDLAAKPEDSPQPGWPEWSEEWVQIRAEIEGESLNTERTTISSWWYFGIIVCFGVLLWLGIRIGRLRRAPKK